uniref:Uncharacterized protein n=1 Tax=Anguilla anguilla TaxID=7936 RepID=A0A0E9WWU7_ANGAN
MVWHVTDLGDEHFCEGKMCACKSVYFCFSVTKLIIFPVFLKVVIQAVCLSDFLNAVFKVKKKNLHDSEQPHEKL